MSGIDGLLLGMVLKAEERKKGIARRASNRI